MTRTVALIANPSSGRGKVARILEPAVERLRAGGLEVEVIESLSPSHATEAAAKAATEHDIVTAVGGDGMVHLVLNGVLRSSAALAVIPAGTGNDFAVWAGYARKDPLAACAAIVAGRERAIDVGRVEGGPAFVCVASAGFDSEVNRLANRIRGLRGTPVYVVATLRTLRRFRPARFAVTLDGLRAEHDAMFVAVGNAGSYGGGMKIAPGAVLDDGLFDVTIVGAMSRGALLRQFPKLFKGTHVEHPAVTTARARSVSIQSERAFYVYADGEEVGPLPVSLTILPKALRVVVP